jgi:hypothetical protein
VALTNWLRVRSLAGEGSLPMGRGWHEA